MNFRRALLSVTATLALLSACSLRPNYRDVVVPEGSAISKPEEGQPVVLRVVDSDSGQPLSGVRVIAAGSRARLATTSDTQGQLTVKVSRLLLEENPLVEVVLPKGVHHYRFEPVVEPAAQPAPAGEKGPGNSAAAPAEVPAAMVADGGTGTDAGL